MAVGVNFEAGSKILVVVFNPYLTLMVVIVQALLVWLMLLAVEVLVRELLWRRST